MAILNTTLYFKDNNRQYMVGSISLDLIISENHNFSNDVTQFNIEDGSTISDHIRRELFRGTLTGKVTNFSLYQPGIFINRAQDVYDKIKEIWNNSDLVTIVTIYDIFTNVAITNISAARDSGTGEAIEFDVSFQEINIVQLQEITIVANVKLTDMISNTNKQSSPKLEVGKQQGVLR